MPTLRGDCEGEGEEREDEEKEEKEEGKEGKEEEEEEEEKEELKSFCGRQMASTLGKDKETS